MIELKSHQAWLCSEGGLAKFGTHERKTTEHGGSPLGVKKLATYKGIGQISKYTGVNGSQVSHLSGKGLYNMKNGNTKTNPERLG